MAASGSVKSRTLEAGMVTVPPTGVQTGLARLSHASMRTGMSASALPLSVKPNAPESKRGGDAGLIAGFQQTTGRSARGCDQPVVPGRW